MDCASSNVFQFKVLIPKLNVFVPSKNERGKFIKNLRCDFPGLIVDFSVQIVDDSCQFGISVDSQVFNHLKNVFIAVHNSQILVFKFRNIERVIAHFVVTHFHEESNINDFHCELHPNMNIKNESMDHESLNSPLSGMIVVDLTEIDKPTDFKNENFDVIQNFKKEFSSTYLAGFLHHQEDKFHEFVTQKELPMAEMAPRLEKSWNNKVKNDLKPFRRQTKSRTHLLVVGSIEKPLN